MSTCRSCGAPVKWVRTTKNKLMPVDLPPTPTGNVEVLDDDTAIVRSQTPIVPMLGVMHTSHFATCPHADEWRNRA